MRKEASLEQWRSLYEVASKIKLMRPWKFLWDMDLITISLPKYKEHFFCSVMGRAGECVAIGTYVGYDAIRDFYRIANCKDIPPEQIMRYQNNMMCYFGNRDELTKNELQLIKDLGLKFRGKNEWIYFQSFKTGYVPYILDSQEVTELTLVFQQLFMAIRAMIEMKVRIDFDDGNTLFRSYDDKDKLWYTHQVPIVIPPKRYMTPVIKDDLLFAKLNKQKAIKDEIELDTLYLNAVITDEKFERPILPKLLILADVKSEMLIDKKMLSPEDNEVMEILDIVINYIFKAGKPKTIYVRDEYIESTLLDLCKRTKIRLKVKGGLRAIDTFARAFSEHKF